MTTFVYYGMAEHGYEEIRYCPSESISSWRQRGSLRPTGRGNSSARRSSRANAHGLAPLVWPYAHRACTSRHPGNYRGEADLILRTGWRDDPAAAAAVAWRATAATAARLTNVAERLGYEWTPAAGMSGPSDRLVFRAAWSFVPVRTSSSWPPSGGPPSAALTSSRSETLRSWTSTAGQRRSGVLPLMPRRTIPVAARGYYRRRASRLRHPVSDAVPRIVGYLGVMPELRGKGYVDDLLGDITRIHAADGADRTDTTDVGNTPMAAAFDRANTR